MKVSCYTICRACYHVTRIASPSTDDGTALLTLYVKYNVLAFFVLHFFVLDPSSLGPGAEPLPKATLIRTGPEGARGVSKVCT